MVRSLVPWRGGRWRPFSTLKGDLSSGEALCRVQTAPPGWGFGPGASRSSDILLELHVRLRKKGAALWC